MKYVLGIAALCAGLTLATATPAVSQEGTPCYNWLDNGRCIGPCSFLCNCTCMPPVVVT